MGAVAGSFGDALPVTGTGPFSMLLAVIGVVSVVVGGLLRRVGLRSS